MDPQRFGARAVRIRIRPLSQTFIGSSARIARSADTSKSGPLTRGRDIRLEVNGCTSARSAAPTMTLPPNEPNKPNEDAAPKQLAGEDRRKARKREAPGDTAITRDHVTSSVSLITNFVTLFVHPDTS